MKISHQCTDAGGGGTRIDLFRKLEEVDRVKNRNEYMHPTCGLHGLNLTLSVPTVLTMGDGGLHKRNALQCLHSAYNLSLQYDSTSWGQLWTLITGEKGSQMKCPVMTRWECVGEGVDHITKNRSH